jgi:hypothetical protein
MLAEMKECNLQSILLPLLKGIVEVDGWHTGSTAERKPVRLVVINPVPISDATVLNFSYSINYLRKLFILFFSQKKFCNSLE